MTSGVGSVVDSVLSVSGLSVTVVSGVSLPQAAIEKTRRRARIKATMCFIDTFSLVVILRSLQKRLILVHFITFGINFQQAFADYFRDMLNFCRFRDKIIKNEKNLELIEG